MNIRKVHKPIKNHYAIDHDHDFTSNTNKFCPFWMVAFCFHLHFWIIFLHVLITFHFSSAKYTYFGGEKLPLSFLIFNLFHMCEFLQVWTHHTIWSYTFSSFDDRLDLQPNIWDFFFLRNSITCNISVFYVAIWYLSINNKIILLSVWVIDF